ncbi:MAG: carboxymuconolactone decarboxylase family protein [Pseudomonas mandelii]|uniref:carboxymuconolactone decarboxylase family protein n=1 Tax=Pseudomonas TaxID=286 RepID=UPI001F2A6F56|nr:carboxymuconolactone decarboxylase family protein [Pseudomonas sp. SW-3]
MHPSESPELTSMFDNIKSASPVLERYTKEVLFGALWQGPELSTRDRSIVTLSVMISRNQSAHMTSYLDLALDNGVSPDEISEIIAHLAFYTGWANAMSAVEVTRSVFEQRGITTDQLSPAIVNLLPVDAAAEEQRALAVVEKFGTTVPELVQFTNDILFSDVWRRPGLSPRDRCLITVCMVIATSQVTVLPFYLNRSMDYGLTRVEVAHVMTQLAFYSGWSTVYSALPFIKDVFESRSS